jgi:transposase
VDGRPPASARHDLTDEQWAILASQLRRPGPGRPRTRPDRVLGDGAYSARANRAHLRRRGLPATIPVKADRQAQRRTKGSAGGRPPAFDSERYSFATRSDK